MIPCTQHLSDRGPSRRKENAWLRYVPFVLVFLCTLFPVRAEGAEFPKRQRILVLNSYHPGYVWSDSIVDGIFNVFEEYRDKVNIYIEYMDSKHHQSRVYYEKLRTLFHHKYKHLHFDLIIACDDNAVDFLLKYKKGLFYSTPVIFCGINDMHTATRAIEMGMRGVFEQWSDKENLDLALDLFPKTKHIAVIADTSPTGRGGLDRIQRLENEYADRVDFTYIAPKSIEHIQECLASLPPHTVILYTVLFRTMDGKWFSHRRGAQIVAQSTDKPIFVISDFSVVQGVVGGHVVSGYHQGARAAEMGLQVLMVNQRPPGLHRAVKIDTLLFDSSGLERFGIPPSQLPDGSLIINKPFSFYQAYRPWIWLTILFIALETLLIVLFALNRRHLKQAKEEVDQTNDRLDLAIRGTEQALFYWDVVADTIVFKYFWKDILGYPDELRAPGIKEWHTHIHPEDVHILETARMDHLQGNTPFYEQEFRVRRADNTWCWLVARGKIMETAPDGTPLQVTGTLRDTTERKQTEQKQQRLVAALEQSEEAIAICDTRGMIHSINQAFADFYHVDPETVRSTPIWNIAPLFNSGPMWDSLETDKGWRDHIQSTFDGDATYDLEVKGSPIKDDRGTTVCYIFSQRDVTRETQLETQLRQAQKMEAIGQLAGGIAHDFNNLLQVIIGYTSKIVEDPTIVADNKNRLEKISDASGKAANLVRQLLIFSRRDMVSRKVVNLNGVIAEVLSLLKRTIGEQTEITFDPFPALPKIEADTSQLHQIIMNLCVNARDAMPEGGTIHITTTHVCLVRDFIDDHPWARQGCFVRLEIRDTGMGIPPEVREHMFEPFFTTKETGKGTGLGLATVYGIVKSHEGLIHVDSTPGKGTAFVIYLPATDAQENQATENCGPDILTPCAATILMAEDDEMVRSLTREVLEDLGYTVIEARDGNEAVELFKQHNGSIDLVLLDVIMPGMTGQQVWEKIQTIRPDLPVIFSSGYSFNELKENTIIAEKGRLIQKPYSPDQLMETIAKALAPSTEK
ncbi:ATP-binding protein [Desulfoplanes sp.]